MALNRAKASMKVPGFVDNPPVVKIKRVFMAQPPLLLRNELTIAHSETGYTPVEKAIRLALKE
jgi:hypothetical protein